jgi:hypothetical protein
MADQDDVRRIALALPGVVEDNDRFAFSVERKGKAKGFVWVWQERVHPKKPRVPQPRVIAARVADELEKATLLAADPAVFFTEPHYNGFPAVLVRLAEVTNAVLRKVVIEAWRCQAPKELVAAHDAGDPATRKADPAGARTPVAKHRPARTAARTAARAGVPSSTAKRLPREGTRARARGASRRRAAPGGST